MKSPKEPSQQERIELAVTACQNNANNFSMRKIARQHGINEVTLRGRLKGCKSRQASHIQRQKLSPEQEGALAHWVTLMHSWG